MTTAFRRAAGMMLAAALVGLLSACGGGFSSAPAAPPDDTIRSYVALGDTFTAAPDTGPSAADDGCRRSDSNYPALAAAELKVTDVRDVSCAGATTASLTAESTPGKNDSPAPAQLQAVGKDTDLVTIGVGLEDRDLLSRAFRICTVAPCGDKVQPQAILDDAGAMATSLTAAVRVIQDRAPDAYIVLVGYPRIVPDAGTCDALPDVDRPTLDAASQVLDAIDSEVRSAARETGVGYLDVAGLSVGHELCSGSPWVEGSKTKAGERLDYRPVAAEQRAVADALVALVRNH